MKGQRRSTEDMYRDPCEVVPRVWLGSQSAAKDLNVLRENHISHIVNTASEVPCHFMQHFEYHRIALCDDADEDVSTHFDAFLGFMKALPEDAAVLIHCQAGISRSVTFLLVFLMAEHSMTLREAFFLIKERRPQAGPNVGYWEQLVAFEQTRLGATTLNLHSYYVESMVEMGFASRETVEMIVTRYNDDFQLALGALLRGEK